MSWFLKAVEQGSASAQYNLGIMYDKGEGVPQDYAEAMDWIRKAAEQGLAAAQFSMGVRYSHGRGVAQDYVKAYAWWNIAAAGGHEKAAEIRETVAQRLSPSQLESAQTLSKELWEIVNKK